MKYLIIRERSRRKKFQKIEAQYLALKFLVHNQKLSTSSRWEASLLLSKISKGYSKVSLKNRCFITGRGRGFSRFFNLSRIKIRELARNNELPFITKSSW
jgi:small subunit ribosomal protein S14